jgi:hypothetical protein
MFAWFNRGICSAFESAAVAELEARLERERAQQLRVVDEVLGPTMSIFIYRCDRLLMHAWLPNDLTWVYDLDEDATVGEEHRLRASMPLGWKLFAFVQFEDDVIEPCRGQIRAQVGCDLSCMLTPAELGVTLRGLLRAAETCCAPDVRQGNADAVRQLAAGLRVQLK